MPTETRTALIIDTPLVWELMTALDPHFNELSYEENIGRYLVLNDEGQRWMIMTPETFELHYDHITNGDPIQTYNFHKK